MTIRIASLTFDCVDALTVGRFWSAAHLDVMTADPEAEVARLVALGATRVQDIDEYGYEWTVLADPEGNEFCLAKTR